MAAETASDAWAPVRPCVMHSHSLLHRFSLRFLTHTSHHPTTPRPTPHAPRRPPFPFLSRAAHLPNGPNVWHPPPAPAPGNWSCFCAGRPLHPPWCVCGSAQVQLALVELRFLQWWEARTGGSLGDPYEHAQALLSPAIGLLGGVESDTWVILLLCALLAVVVVVRQRQLTY